MDMELRIVKFGNLYWRRSCNIRILELEVSKWRAALDWHQVTYNGYFPAELILYFAFFVGVWTFILDD